LMCEPIMSKFRLDMDTPTELINLKMKRIQPLFGVIKSLRTLLNITGVT